VGPGRISEIGSIRAAIDSQFSMLTKADNLPPLFDEFSPDPIDPSYLSACDTNEADVVIKRTLVRFPPDNWRLTSEVVFC
jgi:hypothetical protein